jgi:hypothetical protein
VIEKLPGATGVPVMDPEGASDSPAGRPPEATLQVYGFAPPVATSVAEKAAPTVPFGKLVVVIESVDGATVIDRDLVAFCDAPSVTRAVNVEFPAAVGVPVMAPLELSDNPAGKLPDTMFHVYGAVPPPAVSVAE